MNSTSSSISKPKRKIRKGDLYRQQEEINPYAERENSREDSWKSIFWFKKSKKELFILLFYWTYLDLGMACWGLRMIFRGLPKITFKKRYGCYKFLTMPFGQFNAPTTFIDLIKMTFNHIQIHLWQCSLTIF